MYNILIVEDELLIAQTVAEYLKRDGCSVTHVMSVTDAMEQIDCHTDLVILDLMLPDGNGEDLCEYITSNYSAAVIMLTSKKSEQSKINGFSCGADDYLTKPFSPRELVARVKAVLKRSKSTEDTVTLEAGTIIILNEHKVLKNGRDIKLTPNEYNILLCLVNSAKTIVTREKLIENIKSSDSADRTIDVHVRRLRMKIENNPHEPCIVKTVHGIGYRLGVSLQND